MQQEKDQKQQTSSQTLINFLPIIGIVLLAIIILIGYMFFYRNANQEKSTSSGPTILPTETSTPINDPYADWRTYRNEELGFEFKYPPEWGNLIYSASSSLKGYYFSGRFQNSNPGFVTYSSDWDNGIGGPSFGYYTLTSGEFIYHYSNGNVGPILSPTKIIDIKDSDKALIVGGKEGLKLDTLLRGQSPPPTGYRYAFINLNAPYKDTIVRGVEFFFQNPSSDGVEQFDLMISSFEVLK